jgi:hypothetical protein
MTIWDLRVVVPESVSDAQLQTLRRILPEHAGSEGFESVQVWLRRCLGYAELRMVSTWASKDDLDRHLATAGGYERRIGRILTTESQIYTVVTFPGEQAR